MKTLFLVDGAFGHAKKALLEIICDPHNSACLIKKITTKKLEDNDLPADLQHHFFDDRNHILDDGDAEKMLLAYKGADDESRHLRQYFCYAYPDLDEVRDDNGKPYREEINIIDNEQIDNFINDKSHKQAFIVVRDHTVIFDLEKRYEEESQINVVPVFIYTDYSYVIEEQEKGKTMHPVEKFNALYNEYLKAHGTKSDFSKPIDYEETLLFKGKDYEEAKNNLQKQIIVMINKISTKNAKYFVINKNEKYFLPKRIEDRKMLLQKALNDETDGCKKGIVAFHHRVFAIMPYNKFFDAVYCDVRDKLLDDGYELIRADGKEYSRLCNDDNADINYWLKMYMCGFAIALFDSDGKALIINPNVVYEMGIMKQQGKSVYLFWPQGASYDDHNKMFFDIRNKMREEYVPNNMNDLVAKIISKVKKHQAEVNNA
ncbi:MAG: hypothetical protein HDT28_01215 [Clostridiales bacterium]|nr:hypothetical protein [Clostridiales bacterium]